MIDNLIQIASGTNVTAGFYRITGHTDTNTVTLDRAPDDGVGGVSAGVGKVGGALATPGKAAAEATVSDQKIYIKSGTYTLTTSTPGAGGPVVLATDKALLIEGYETTRGDLGAKPVINAGAETSIELVKSNGGLATNQWVINLKADGNSGSGVSGFRGGAIRGDTFYLCESVACPNYGFYRDGVFFRCLADGNGYGFYSDVAGPRCVDCEAKNSTNAGFWSDGSVVFVRCLSRDNGGVGFNMQTIDDVVSCTAYNNTSDGFKQESATWSTAKYTRCLAVDNWGYGFNVGQANMTVLFCAGYNNSSSDLNPADLLRSIGFQSLTGDPFVNAAIGDFRLNNTAGAGAACRGAGGGVVSQTNNIDIGAVQHTDPAGGGGAASILGGGQLTGGFA